ESAKRHDSQGFSIRDMEHQLILDMLETNLSKSKIAEKLKISRPTLYNKLRKYGIPYQKKLSS
ncbi:MAG: helix-turn-helix domain-containing protein, partial [Syntrophales bacterium]|nr:helix-turn-helix domain-containing protein [Syntrophales bacterium]